MGSSVTSRVTVLRTLLRVMTLLLTTQKPPSSPLIQAHSLFARLARAGFWVRSNVLFWAHTREGYQVSSARDASL